jgi:hypothetical protein
MDETRTKPWDPDHRWADLLIALLLLLSLWSVLAVRQGPRPEPLRAGMQARAQELTQAAFGLVPNPALKKPLRVPPGSHFWDRALLGILAAEQGERDPRPEPLGSAKPGSPEAIFQQAWMAAYAEGSVPEASALERLRGPLGSGFAYWSLRARLAERAAEDPTPYRTLARQWALPRLAALALGGSAVLLLGLMGLVAALVFLVTRKGPHPIAPLPAPGMSWRALALAFLGWFLALRLSGTVALLCISGLHLPRALALPIAYTFHVLVGLGLLRRCLGLPIRAAWRQMTPGPKAHALAWAVAFLGIAVAAVVLAGLLASPWLRGSDSPQRDLMDLVGGTHNPVLMLLLLLTIAGLAPLFEEWLFRGILLPWLGRHLAPRLGERGGWALATLVSGLVFGAIHLQPAGLPTLTTLGLVLAWAFRRTGNLWTSVAIHASWNAGVFLFMRVLA